MNPGIASLNLKSGFLFIFICGPSSPYSLPIVSVLFFVNWLLFYRLTISFFLESKKKMNKKNPKVMKSHCNNQKTTIFIFSIFFSPKSNCSSCYRKIQFVSTFYAILPWIQSLVFGIVLLHKYCSEPSTIKTQPRQPPIFSYLKFCFQSANYNY